MPTDVDHMLRKRRRLLDYSLSSLDPLTTVDGIYRGVHESAIGVVHYARYRSGFDPLESATIRFRSANRPFSSENDLCCVEWAERK